MHPHPKKMLREEKQLNVCVRHERRWTKVLPMKGFGVVVDASMQAGIELGLNVFFNGKEILTNGEIGLSGRWTTGRSTGT